MDLHRLLLVLSLLIAVGGQGPETTRIERETLIEFYDSLGGDHWTNKTGWKVEGWNHCRRPGDGGPWAGLICDESGRVTHMNLNHNNMRGTIPESFWTGLGQLRRFNLAINHVGGTLSNSICKAPFLQTFAAPINREMTGTIPACLPNMPLMEELILEETAMYGKIPNTPFRMLKVLVLSESRFSGTIPDFFDAMGNLRVLVMNGGLKEGKLKGGIPPSIWRCPNLQLISFQHHGLNGTIGSFQDMKKLKELHLNDNKLTGEIPESFYKRMTKWTNQTRIMHFENNRLSGRLDKRWDQIMNLHEVGLANNRFSGYIPGGFQTMNTSWFPKRKLAFSDNFWLPPIPAWARAMGAKSTPMGTSKVTPNFMPRPFLYGNGTYDGLNIRLNGTRFQDWQDTIGCGFIRPGIALKMGAACDKPDCIFTPAKRTPSKDAYMCDPVTLDFLGNVAVAVVFNGDDFNHTQNVTHIVSNTQTMIMYEPHPQIFSVTPTSGRFQGCDPVTIHGYSFVDTHRILCYFNDTAVPGTYVNNVTITCPSPPVDEKNMYTPYNIGLSMNNGTNIVRRSNITFSYYDFCELSAYDSLMGTPNCPCGLCACSSFGTCKYSVEPPEGRSEEPNNSTEDGDGIEGTLANAIVAAWHQTTDTFTHLLSLDDEDSPTDSIDSAPEPEGEHPPYPYCKCITGFAGKNCSSCAAGYFSSKCQVCDCENGKCVDGRTGTGRCKCEMWWSGKRCDYFNKPLFIKACIALAISCILGLWYKTRGQKGASDEERTPLMSGDKKDEMSVST